MNTIKLSVLLLSTLLLLAACNQEPEQADSGKPVTAMEDTSELDVVEDSQDSKEISDPDDPPERSYSEEQLATFSRLLEADPGEARTLLLDEGAVLDSDYLITYIRDARTNMVVRMIASGMDLNAPAENGKRPLAEAFLQNDPYLIDLMIEHGADPLLGDQADVGVGRSFLHYATKIDNPNMVERLLSLGVEPDTPDKYDQTPLDVAATYGEEAAMKVLLDHGADPSRMDANGSVPILLAAGYGNLGAVKLLLAHGADINFQHERGWTPLLLSINYNHTEAINYLLDNGADYTARLKTGFGAAAVAITVNNAEILRRLIDMGAPLDTIIVVNGRNLIHMCIEFRMPEFIEEFARHGVDPALADNEGMTPLALAREVGDAEGERILMELTGPPPADVLTGSDADNPAAVSDESEADSPQDGVTGDDTGE